MSVICGEQIVIICTSTSTGFWSGLGLTYGHRRSRKDQLTGERCRVGAVASACDVVGEEKARRAIGPTRCGKLECRPKNRNKAVKIPEEVIEIMDSPPPRPPCFPPIPQETFNTLKRQAIEGCKIQLERIKRRAAIHSFHDVDENAEDIVTQYVQILRDESIKTANQVHNTDYLKNVMKKEMESMMELNMVVMSKNKMQEEVEKYTIEIAVYNANAPHI